MEFIGWVLVRLLYVDVNINKYNPLRASSYIPLPPQIAKKKAVVNVQNDDNYCFGWAVVAAICEPHGKRNRTTSYVHPNQCLQFRDIEMPVKLSDIAKFETYNPQISVNVYGLELVFSNKKYQYEIVGPLHYTGNKRIGHINLLLITNDEGNSHYCWIRDFSRLVSQQVTCRNGVKSFCDGCLNYFKSEQHLLKHLRHDCNYVYTKLPSTDLVTDKMGRLAPENILRFQNFQRQLQVPFVVYADFETLLKPIDTCQPDPQNSFTISTCEHQPYSFAYFIKCSYDDNLSKFELYRGEDVVDVFMKRLESDVKRLYTNHLKNEIPMKPLESHEIQNYKNACTCHICEKSFGENDIKVHDHCHLTGKYRGAAHSVCNLNFKIQNFFPIFFHNLNYDSHLFIKQLANRQEQIDVIPQTKEKYVSFSKHILVDEIPDSSNDNPRKIYISMRFLDSFRFMQFSLSKLAETLTADQCVQVRKSFGDGTKFDLMRRKGVFPYSYVNSFSTLDQTFLPTMEEFYDTVRGEGIVQTDYDRAVKVWKTFNCKTLGEYSDIYLKSDVLILTDIFENYRTVCLKHYKLDPAHYYTVPGLSWDAMLKYTTVELELLTDLDMLHFFKKGIRGGVSTCISRKSIANNPFVENYDANKPTSFIMYLDATNLYGWAMRQYLPKSNFTWMTADEISTLDVLGIPDTSDTGYVLEVDLGYPQYLQNDHNDLPYCPELLIPPNSKFKNSKLIPNLNDKHKYIIHYRNLKQCLDAGLTLRKIYRALKFIQAPWLQPYIDLNTKLRNQSANAFEKDCFKLKTNSVFGKTMENVDKRIDMKLVSHWEKVGKRRGAEILTSKPNFKDRVIFCDTLVAIQFNRTSILYDKPMYVGFSILDISKTVMYDFFYNFLKQQYHNNVSLLYTDTDSLILEIFTENFYTDMKKHLNRFDTSNYCEDWRHEMPVTESVVGKMKDEFAGIPISSFYGTAAKSYCVSVADKEIIKAKGISKSATEQYLTASTYKAIAEGTSGSVLCQMYSFRSHLHTMYTELRNKIALSCFDDKRYVIPRSTKTLAWGHDEIESRNLDELLELVKEIDNQN